VSGPDFICAKYDLIYTFFKVPSEKVADRGPYGYYAETSRRPRPQSHVNVLAAPTLHFTVKPACPAVPLRTRGPGHAAENTRTKPALDKCGIHPAEVEKRVDKRSRRSGEIASIDLPYVRIKRIDKGSRDSTAIDLRIFVRSMSSNSGNLLADWAVSAFGECCNS